MFAFTTASVFLKRARLGSAVIMLPDMEMAIDDFTDQPDQFRIKHRGAFIIPFHPGTVFIQTDLTIPAFQKDLKGGIPLAGRG